MKNAALFVFILLSFQSCGQIKEQKTNEFFVQVMLQVKHCDMHPVYNLQVNKTGCRMLLDETENVNLNQ